MTGEALSGGGFGGGGGGGGNGTTFPSMSGSALPSGTASAGNSTSATTTAASSSSTQNAYSGADATAAAAMLNTVPTDQESFLRGTWKADSEGHWTMHSIFPGWYSGRSVHFHIKGGLNLELTTGARLILVDSLRERVGCREWDIYCWSSDAYRPILFQRVAYATSRRPRAIQL